MQSPDRDETNGELRRRIKRLRNQKKLILKRLIKDVTKFNHSVAKDNIVTKYSIASE